MTNRPETIESFIRIAQGLFESEKLPEGGRAVAAKVFERLKTASDDGVRHHTRYPAQQWLDTALAPFMSDASAFGDAARALKALESDIGWTRRTVGEHGGDNWIESHVHGMICGPGGAESRYDVQLGFTVMAPHTRYPDHSHPPEEAYVLFSTGDFKQRDGDWIDPGAGGGIHNVRNSLHAMRAGDTPFFAMWCLLV